PFTSPAEATDSPERDWSCSPDAVQAGLVARPDGEPRKTKARPFPTGGRALKGPKPLAPTMTSEYPSPFTSPAQATENPKQPPAWSPSNVHAGVIGSPDGEPR